MVIKISVEVAYATPEKQLIIPLQVEEGTTIDKVIYFSGILDLFPEIDLSCQKVGIFSHCKQLTDIVREGDRVEIYRSLLIDPKEARRKRVKKK